MEANLTIYESNIAEIFSNSDDIILSKRHITRGAPYNASVRVWCTVQLYSIINITSIVSLQDIFVN